MTLADWSAVATIAQSVVAVPAAIAAAVAAWFVLLQIRSAHSDNLLQIKSQQDENRKWKTLDVCAQYEFSDSVSNAARVVQLAFDNGHISNEDCEKIYREAKVVLNYLDGVAIGVGQGLYIEPLARDHLKQIVRFHVDKLLDQNNCTRLRLSPKDYQFVIEMDKKWQKDQPYYHDGD